MKNVYAAEIALLQPCKPLYEGHVPNGWETPLEIAGGWEMHHSVSDEGRAHLAELAVIWGQHSDNLAAFMDVFGQTRCSHNRPLDELEWTINDYVQSVDGCSGLWPWFTLWGAHHDLDPIVHQDAHADGWAFCSPYEYHVGVFMRAE